MQPQAFSSDKMKQDASMSSFNCTLQGHAAESMHEDSSAALVSDLALSSHGRKLSSLGADDMRENELN